MVDADSITRLNAALEGRYRIERELGEGGMATVYLAEDLRHGRQVALKVLRPEVANALGPERFLREIETVARLTHPHILPLHDSGEADGLLFYVMPYVEDETLRERLEREGALPVDDAVRIASECAEALEHAHAQGIIHRDLKPANILFSGGHAVVADFGIARAVEGAADEQALTRTGMSVGTVGYMSPEQATGERTVDERTDVYALGCVLYEMLTGERAFGGRTAQAVMAKQLMEAPPTASVLRRSVPKAVDGVLQGALRPHPADRYGTAAELRAELATAQGAGGERRGKAATRSLARRPAVAGVVLLILGVLAYTGSVYVGGDTAEPGMPEIRSLAVLPLEILAADPEAERYFADGLTEALTSELGQIDALTVISRTSTKRYRGTDKAMPVIAQELGVEGLIEGSIRQADEEVGITLRLIHGPTDQHVWSGSYQRPLRDILQLQADIIRAVVDEVQVALTGDERARLEAAGPVDPDAYTLVLRGNFEMGRGTEPAFRRAAAYYRDAIAVDSTFAPAYAGLAMALIELGSWFASMPPESVYPEAREAARRAIELDPSDAAAHMALGRIHFYYEWDWSEAERAFRRGIELGPKTTYSLFLYQNSLIWLGRLEEAVEIGRTMVERDPQAAYTHVELGFALEFLDRHDEAMEEYRRAEALEPDKVNLHLVLASQHARREAWEEAGRHARRAESLLGDTGPPVWMARLGEVYAAIDRRTETERILAELRARSAHEYVPEGAMAILYLAVGDEERALEFLGRGLEERDVTMVSLAESPHWDPLRDDPRFQAIVDRMDFPG